MAAALAVAHCICHLRPGNSLVWQKCAFRCHRSGMPWDTASLSASRPRGDDAGKNAAGIGHFVPGSEWLWRDTLLANYP
jgi:hypothetical protein